ncbi:hypothetical protein [Robinsoniella peoriensis]|uniref:hypothetical protein n=1 Tax=Robinsoniella peoriensis TaxID=180332 RepID=UPI003628FD1A
MDKSRRNQLKEFVEREFIGPDPIDWEGHRQANGEEILCSDPPRTRYIAGVLFPKEITETESSEVREGELEEVEQPGEKDNGENSFPQNIGSKSEYLEDAEELINRSNAYRQSAISMTVAIRDNDSIRIEVSAGKYVTMTSTDPRTNKKISRYPRTKIEWDNNNEKIVFPVAAEGMLKIPVGDSKMQLDITYRYRNGDNTIYTFSLENTIQKPGAFKDDDCFFQVKFRLFSEKGFCPLADNQRINTEDEDYISNLLLYRDIRNYAIGHGCATDWDDSSKVVKWVETAIFPSYEVKPIVPGVISGVTLEMLNFGPKCNFENSISELYLMCQSYEEWICELEKEDVPERHKTTSLRHIKNCRDCLLRMRKGVDLLRKDEKVRIAFQYMNLAMLMQQLHYNLPLQSWEDDGNDGIVLSNALKKLPDPYDMTTWYDTEHKHYGKWRPFQLAFVLMNLESMADRRSCERDIIDLIWFPTGGGKTEAYLGLSAYTIFIRRLLNKDNSGTAILMRYTLRLLTAQQYERASSMICACELLRKERSDLFGRDRISIGLWVGESTTPNTMQKAVKAYEDLYKDKNVNPFVLLKCPWCGAQMGVVHRKNGARALPGYYCKKGDRRKKTFMYVCSNKANGCSFSNADYPLPLHVIDDVIYNEKPTLVLGTVDKFAMLPFRPKAQGLFGYYDGEKLTSPDLIIQDELHLISGPLGSMVGHYETMVHELCKMKTGDTEIRPKIIASTATISRAKEQCHALYGCSKDVVFQFPPSGLNAGDSYFAKEDKDSKGRQYIGILANGSSSDATTAIRLYASLLYGAKEMSVAEEMQRDPYWTNMGYFNSIRELGQARTWIRADIDQHLDVIYKRRLYDKKYSKEEYRKFRRYIWRDEELTSRIPGDKVTASLSKLNLKYPAEVDDDGKVIEYPIDICLATNMISVGLDVPRLGLMTVSGQPKTTSEYIQSTSRVGRDMAAPGIVFVLYRPGRPRDKSHYEHFKDYHSRLYCNVEPTSVTPFSAPVRDRALHAIIIGMLRLESDLDYNNSRPKLPSPADIKRIEQIIKDRVEGIDPDELDASLARMKWVLEHWEDHNPACWEPKYNRDLSYTSDAPLMYHAGNHKNDAWGACGIETPTSMRNVDASCEAEVMPNRYYAKEV